LTVSNMTIDIFCSWQFGRQHFHSRQFVRRHFDIAPSDRRLRDPRNEPESAASAMQTFQILADQASSVDRLCAFQCNGFSVIKDLGG
jgi:hypothetical protein